MSGVPILVLGLYALLVLALLAYGLNCLVMVFLFRRRYKDRVSYLNDLSFKLKESEWPVVTTQIPVYNEANVVARVMRAAAEMEYAGHHQIQVLDDSNDETSAIIDLEVECLRAKGLDVEVVRRSGREGFKAGALSYAHDKAKGNYIAVFDADFVPPKDFLIQTLPHFVQNEKLGLIQARWGHLNAEASTLTRIQALGIDGHFMVEQSARCWNDLYMNFNGTAGIWRKKAIESGGGWSSDTLTEDMDLSYRVQMEGWQTEYLPHLVVPAEIPEELKALKSQQFRWAKGSTQTAMKLLPTLYRKHGLSFKWVQSFLHMTHYLVHPLMIMIALLSWPMIHFAETYANSKVYQIGVLTVLLLSMSSTNMLYVVSQKAASRQTWLKKLFYLPFLMVLGVGLAVNNTRAVLEALWGHQSDFIRTPKRGDQTQVHYRTKLPWMVVLELLLGIYCTFTIFKYLSVKEFLVSPFIMIYALGFLGVGLLTIVQSRRLEGGFKFLSFGDKA